jgi:hypothetical protein
VLAACSILVSLLASSGYILSQVWSLNFFHQSLKLYAGTRRLSLITNFLMLTQHWVSLSVAVILSLLLEAYTTQLDNAFIPLVFYSLLCL